MNERESRAGGSWAVGRRQSSQGRLLVRLSHWLIVLDLYARYQGAQIVHHGNWVFGVAMKYELGILVAFQGTLIHKLPITTMICGPDAEGGGTYLK